VLFIIERFLRNPLSDSESAVGILVYEGRWIYRTESDAARILRGCEPDDEDEIQYRIRKIDREEALKFHSSIGYPHPSLVEKRGADRQTLSALAKSDEIFSEYARAG
jgi:hypothetical protein